MKHQCPKYYGVGLTGDMRAKALALIEEGQAARERAAIMAEQAAYALRYLCQ
jgi:hypothetical protein